MTDFFKYWNERIRRDLASFGDPGARVDIDGSERKFRAAWTMRGEPREATFSLSRDQGVWVTEGGTLCVPYPTFVSGPGMADLRHVAQMIQSARRPMLYVPARAKSSAGPVGSGIQNKEGPAIDVINARLDEDADTTRVIMITGGAGAGKTCVLRELVRRQAEAYLSGRTSKLLLYVNAQGRALARLNEALATELQDLKVGLTYHSVAVLSQLGVLVPVIDGFDELLGVSGYDDAFSSLAGFLEQLHGEGQILASARSTYYEEEFLERAGRASANGDQEWSHVPVTIQEWSDDDRRNYLDKLIEKKSWQSSEAEAFRRRVTTTFSDGRHRTLASKPLFFARVVDLLHHPSSSGDDDLLSGDDDLLQTLVQEYSSRELKEKLLDRQSRRVLTSDQFGDLMQELAEEMWNQETRSLDVGSIRFVAEYFVHDAGLPDTAKQVIVERLPAMAFLGRHDAPSARGGIAFEHELFFFYFLARTIAARLAEEGADLRVILGRSALPEEVADRVAQEMAETRGPAVGKRLQTMLNRLSKAAEQESRRMAQVRENAGLLAMALLRNASGPDAHPIEGRTIRSVVFPGSHLKNVTLEHCSLIDVAMRRTDLSSTRFAECTARDVRLHEPRVSRESSRLELSGLGVDDVTGIRVLDVASEANFDPAFIAKTLQSCGAPITDVPGSTGPAVSKQHLLVMERLMQVYRRTNLVCLQDNLSMFSTHGWPEVQQRLVEHGIVSLEERATSGRPKQFLRSRFLPAQIMEGLAGRPDTDPQIRAFWEALAAPARQLEQTPAPTPVNANSPP